MDSYSQFMEIFELLSDDQQKRLLFLAKLMAQGNEAAPDSADNADSHDSADKDA